MLSRSKNVKLFSTRLCWSPRVWMIFYMKTIQKSNIKWCQAKKFLFCWCYKKYHFYYKNMMEKGKISLIVSEYFSKKKTLFTFFNFLFLLLSKWWYLDGQKNQPWLNHITAKIPKNCFKIISTTVVGRRQKKASQISDNLSQYSWLKTILI